MKTIKRKKYKNGAVLSGGVARGFAHVGVLQAMHEAGIKPEIISGVSAGSVVGAFYADGFEPQEILDFFLNKRFIELVKIVPSKTGLLKMNGLKALLKKNLKANTFDELKKPLVVAVTNYKTGMSEYISTGNLFEAVLASSSIPVLWQPYKLDGVEYVDGGITDNLPVKPIMDLCRNIYGVHVNPIGKMSKNKGLVSTALRSFHISVASGIEQKRRYFKLFIEPLELRKFGLLEVMKGREMYEIGYEEAKRNLEEQAVNTKKKNK